MFGNLPDHLQGLNHINSPPSNALNAETEEAFWDFMHTDQLFDNFGVAASPPKLFSPKVAKKELDKSPVESANTPTLESFIAAFANDTSNAAPVNYRMPVPLPLPYNSAASSSAPTPAAAIDPAAIMPFTPSPQDDRISGAKRLKQIGAGPAEIEEDKRRRNTEASARFRAKKKERETALEIRAKELEAQVAQLVTEKASLENENKLLKAIVLGGQGGSDIAMGQLEQFANANANKRKRVD